MDLPQVDIFLILDFFVSLRSREILTKSRQVDFPTTKPTGQGGIIGKDFQKV